ncbi:MAG: hypothetical protein SF162_10060 [bacterium]|nr:hypothetical protein [bacterium]
MTSNPNEILEAALDVVRQPDFVQDEKLNAQQYHWIRTICQRAEHHKAIVAALLTSLLKKVVTPEQDIRQHKIVLPNGYSGRSFDTLYVTPFLSRHFRHLAMAESGWLTRSLEQLAPFDLQFPGRIRDAAVKDAFLRILDSLQNDSASAYDYMLVLLAELNALAAQFPSRTESQALSFVSVQTITQALKAHFFTRYSGSGASRLPVVALYSIYQLLMDTKRYDGKRLLPLKKHTTSDRRARSLADIEIIENESGAFFEIVEIKHQKPVTIGMLETLHAKLSGMQVSRCYVLTTADPNIGIEEQVSVETFIQEISLQTGCEIIVNGVIPSLKYYLRLVDRPERFLQLYSDNLYADAQQSGDVKSVHLKQWDALLKEITS